MANMAKRKRWVAPGIAALCVAICTVLPAVAVVETVTGVAQSAIAVDVRAEVCVAVDAAVVGYSPSWGGVTNDGAYVVLQKVVGVTTNTLATFAADAEDVYAFSPDAAESRFVRFIHRVYSSGGVEIGEPLVRDVAFGYRSAEGAAFVADSRTNSLQEAVFSGGDVNLAYDTGWATNAASVAISAVKLSGEGGGPVATNDLFSAVADVDGTTPMRGVGSGWWRLFCRLTDASGNALLEYETCDFKMKGGIVISFR